MAKTPKKQKPEDVELRPDGWERFERQMDKIAPPKKLEKPNSEKPSRE